MKTVDFFKSNRTVMSAEVFPPKKSGTIESVVRALRDIAKVKPDFVSVTYGAGGEGAQTTADVASIALDAFGLTTVAHMTAVNMTRGKLLDLLDSFKRKGIENILVLRGDVAQGSKFFDFHHADELASYISSIEPSFNLIGACYPEKHPEAPSFEEDITNLKRKTDAGVAHLMTQLFFDNSKFYTFLDKVRGAGITVPIEAGIMPILNVSQVEKMLSFSNAYIPKKLRDILDSNPSDMYSRGLDFAAEQIDDLIAHGCDGIHLYTMNNGQVAVNIFERFKEKRYEVRSYGHGTL